jgi:hypothetical protein
MKNMFSPLKIRQSVLEDIAPLMSQLLEDSPEISDARSEETSIAK